LQVWGVKALGVAQRLAESGLHVQFLLAVIEGIREGVEQLQPLAQVPDRFQIGGALDGALTCPLPGGNSLVVKSASV
jgi:hypothetical protein